MEKKPISKKILSYTLRTLLVILITVVILVASLYCLLFILAKGPSPTLSRTFVLTVKETSAGGFLADMFFTQEIEHQLREQAKIENDSQILNLSDKELHDLVMCVLRDYLINQEERKRESDI